MKVILISDIKNIGQKGEEKEVKPGFARNFLFPKKLAVTVDSVEAQKIIAEKDKKQSSDRKAKEDVELKMAKISDKKINITRKTTKQGKLYAGVDADEIQKLVEENFQIKPKEIVADLPIKSIGEYQISVKFASSKKVDFTLVITAETS